MTDLPNTLPRISIGGSPPSAAPGFTYDGQHSSTFDLWLLRSPVPLTPPVRETLIPRPARSGAIDGPAYAAPRIISLECAIRATSEEELRRKAREIAAWLDPTRGLRPLVLDTEPQIAWWSRLSRESEAQIRAGQGFFTASFVVPDGYARSISEISEPAVLPSGGQRPFEVQGQADPPFVVEVGAATESPRGLGLDDLLSTLPAVSLGALPDEGIVQPTNFTLRFLRLATQEEVGRISFRGSVPVGQLLVVDTERMTARLADRNVLDRITGNFPRLPAGELVAVEYSAANGLNVAYVNVRYFGRYW